ncbi:MAG: IS4 family transposase, partial [Candidatus Sericytochromatia bacterium]
PAGSEPLEWLLLSDQPITTVEQALEVALQYVTRWVIEDFHKALKTGLGAERLYLEDAHRLFAAISVMSVDALRLLELRETLRVTPDAPAEASGLDKLELKILKLKTKRVLKTVNDVNLALGRLGGHMNRKADGPPGLITLWRGMKKLKALVEGARLGSQLSGFG